MARHQQGTQHFANRRSCLTDTGAYTDANGNIHPAIRRPHATTGGQQHPGRGATQPDAAPDAVPPQHPVGQRRVAPRRSHHRRPRGAGHHHGQHSAHAPTRTPGRRAGRTDCGHGQWHGSAHRHTHHQRPSRSGHGCGCSTATSCGNHHGAVAHSYARLCVGVCCYCYCYCYHRYHYRGQHHASGHSCCLGDQPIGARTHRDTTAPDNHSSANRRPAHDDIRKRSYRRRHTGKCALNSRDKSSANACGG